MKANITEVPLSSCREKYSTTGLLQANLPENLLETQMCASGQKDSKFVDACQVIIFCLIVLQNF